MAFGQVNESWPDVDRRDPQRFDRREVTRGGRRVTDLPHPIPCPSCGKTQAVRGLANSRAVRWCHCLECGEVWPWAINL